MAPFLEQFDNIPSALSFLFVHCLCYSLLGLPLIDTNEKSFILL